MNPFHKPQPRQFTEDDVRAIDARVTKDTAEHQKWGRRLAKSRQYRESIEACVRNKNRNTVVVAALAKIFPTTDDISTERAPPRRPAKPTLIELAARRGAEERAGR